MQLSGMPCSLQSVAVAKAANAKGAWERVKEHVRVSEWCVRESLLAENVQELGQPHAVLMRSNARLLQDCSEL